MTENIYPSTYIDTKKSSFYRVVDKKIIKNISLSTYKEQKRSENAKDWEKNLKILALYLLHCKKELVLLHPDEKNFK